MTHVEPTTPAAAAETIADYVFGLPGRIRLAVDAPPCADPAAIGDAVVAALDGRPALHVRADRFWRAASLRFEFGRQNPDEWLTAWLDEDALRREVLEPFAESGQALPGLRDPDTDRSLRIEPVILHGDAVLVVSGSALLGRGLPFDASVHVRLSPAALERRTPESQRWILPALVRYSDEYDPEGEADLVVRWDDPKHPAVVVDD